MHPSIANTLAYENGENNVYKKNKKYYVFSK